MAKDIFEESELKLEAKLARGKWKGTPAAKFIFIKDGTDQAPVDGTIDGLTVKCTYKPAKVDDDKASYTLNWRVEAEEQKILGSEEIVVWPKGCVIKFFKEDENKAKVAAPGVPFRIMQKGEVADKCLSWPDGTIEYKFKDPATATVEMAAPFEVVEWTKGAEDKGRDRQLTVKSNFKADIVSPRPTDDIKIGTETKKGTRQAVNLTTASGKGGRDGRGNIVEVIVGAEGDTGRDDKDRLGKEGAYVFVKCTFSNSSKRNDPKVALMDVKDLKKTSDLKTQTGCVTLGKDGTAKFKINLGLVGGETCQLQIGATKTCEDATTWFENWRMIYYQLTHPDLMAVPDFAKAKGAFEKVKIILEEHEVRKLSEAKPAGAWVPKADLGSPTDPAFVVGDHDKFFEALFTPASERVHVLLCDAQFDGGKPHHVQEAGIKFDKADAHLAGNKFSFTAKEVVPGFNILPTAVQNGKHALKDGKWTCDALGTRGKIAAGDVAIDWAANQAAKGKVTVTLPGDAVAALTANQKVKLTLSFYLAKGPYTGWSTGKHVIIKSTGRPEIDVNKTLVHEVGHAIKLTGNSRIPGLPMSEHTRQYFKRGHQGGHCANGAKQPAFDSGLDMTGNADCTCVMYGEASDKKGVDFCDLCTPFVLAEVIDAIGEGKEDAESREEVFVAAP